MALLKAVASLTVAAKSRPADKALPTRSLRPRVRPAGGRGLTLRTHVQPTLCASRRNVQLSCAASSSPAEESRKVMVNAADVLSELLKAETAPRIEAVAKKNVDLLDEQFFLMASTYIEMAKREGQDQMVKELERVLKIAMAEKEKTLRPEIRLLNRLLRCPTASSRAVQLEAAANALTSDNRYFFTLVERMKKDVGMQQDNEQKQKLLKQLSDILTEAELFLHTIHKEE